MPLPPPGVQREAEPGGRAADAVRRLAGVRGPRPGDRTAAGWASSDVARGQIQMLAAMFPATGRTTSRRGGFNADTQSTGGLDPLDSAWFRHAFDEAAIEETAQGADDGGRAIV